MIYTLTLNPALDYVAYVESYKSGDINRTSKTTISAGGKGINVSLVLKELDTKSVSLGFIAGFTGEEIKRQLDESGIETDFVILKNGSSRINVKIKSDLETDINASGPEILNADVEKMLLSFDNLCDGDYLVLSGSVPKGVPQTIYCDIMKRLCHKKINFVVDAEGELLISTLKYKPFLIKPNHHELGAIFNTEITDNASAIHYIKKLQEMGATNVLVSMGKDGAVFVSGNGDILSSPSPKGQLINSTCAGDSMVAGFIAGYIKENSFDYALRLGICSGSATAFSEGLGNKEKIFNLLESL